MEQTQKVYTSLDKQDIEALLRAYTDKFNDETCRLRLEEEAIDAYNEEIRPIIKKMANYVELWEDVNRRERSSDDLRNARMARNNA